MQWWTSLGRNPIVLSATTRHMDPSEHLHATLKTFAILDTLHIYAIHNSATGKNIHILDTCAMHIVHIHYSVLYYSAT